MCLNLTEKPDLMTHKILYSPRSLGSSFISTATYCVICAQIYYKVAQKDNVGQIRGSDEFSLCGWFKAEAPSKEQGMENSLVYSALWCEFCQTLWHILATEMPRMMSPCVTCTAALAMTKVVLHDLIHIFFKCRLHEPKLKLLIRDREKKITEIEGGQNGSPEVKRMISMLTIMCSSNKLINCMIKISREFC